MTATARFDCNAVDTFDLAALPAWIVERQRAGSIPTGGSVELEVRHPDREMDGSCRWCGCRENETITFEESQLRRARER